MRYKNTNRLKKCIATMLGIALYSQSFVAAGPIFTFAGAKFSEADVYDVLLDAIGISAENVTETDCRKVYSDLVNSSDFLYHAAYTTNLDSVIEEAKSSGKIVVSDAALLDAIYDWVDDVYSRTRSSVSATLGLEGDYDFSDEYMAVERKHGKYAFVTPTNTWVDSEIAGSFTIDLENPIYTVVNETTGKTALDANVSIEDALLLFTYDEYSAFAADDATTQSLESKGRVEQTEPTRKVMGDIDYPGTKHVHSGNGTTGGGCYTAPKHHSHVDGCYETKYALAKDQQVVVNATMNGNGYKLEFYSASLISYFMSINTNTEASNSQVHYTYENQRVSAKGSLQSVFSGEKVFEDFNKFAQHNANVAGGTEVSFDMTWQEIWQELGTYLAQIGYTEDLCPSRSKNAVIVCGMTTNTVVGYTINCGLEEGKYYNGLLTEVQPISDKVVTAAEVLHPQQRVTKGNTMDTSVKFTFLDGHTEIVNAVGSASLAKYTIEGNYDKTYAKLGLYPYKIKVNALFGDNATEAADKGQTQKEFTVLVETVDAFNASSDDSQQQEQDGYFKELGKATESEHTDACYKGIKHKHTEACMSGVVKHTHSAACGYNFLPKEKDLQVLIHKAGNIVNVIYYSDNSMLKAGFTLTSGSNVVGAGTSTNLADKLSFDVYDDDAITDTDAPTMYTKIVSILSDRTELTMGYNAFCNAIYSGYGNSLDSALAAMTDTCLGTIKDNLNAVSHEYACGKTTDTVESCSYICNKDESKYYSGDEEVQPECDKVIVSAEVVQPLQSVYCNEDICTIVKLEFLDGHSILVNRNGSAEGVTVSTDYVKDDYQWVGEQHQYKIKVTGYFGQTALLAQNVTRELPVLVTMFAASDYTVNNSIQVIVQGNDFNYDGYLTIGEDTITDEDYKKLSATFTNDLDPEATGRQTVQLRATIGSYTVFDTITAWIVPKPTTLTVTPIQDDVEAGTEPRFNIDVEYGLEGTEGYLKFSNNDVSESDLKNGVQVDGNYEYLGVTGNFSETVRLDAVTNSAIEAGELGVDYNTGGIYNYNFSSAGNEDLQTTATVNVHSHCVENEQHADYYADSCPVCDYQNEKQEEFNAKTDRLQDVIDDIQEKLAELQASYDADSVSQEDVLDRYGDQYNTLEEQYRKDLQELKDKLQEYTEEKERLEGAYKGTVTKEDVDTKLEETEQSITDAESYDTETPFESAKDQFTELEDLVGKSETVRGTEPTISLSGLTTESTEETKTVYTKEYDGESVNLEPTVSAGETSEFDSDFLDSFPYKIQLMGDEGEFQDFSGEIKDAGEYHLKYVSLDTEYKQFKNAFVTIKITKKPVTCEAAIEDKVYDGTNVATFSQGGLTGVLPEDDAELTENSATFNQKTVGTGIDVTLAHDISLEGDDAGNYEVIQPEELKADITARPLTCTVIAEKVYDATTSITVQFTELQNVVPDDDVEFKNAEIIATLSSKNVTSGVTAVLSEQPELVGDESVNYSYTVPTITAVIKPKEVSCSAKAEDKVYDGKTDATLTVSDLTGVEAGDAASLPETISGHFSQIDAGKDISVTPDGNIALAGQDADNYSLQVNGKFTAEIKPKKVEYTLTAEKVYDGTTDAVITISEVTGFLEQDEACLDTNQLIGEYESDDASSSVHVTIKQSLSILNNEAGNYECEQPTECTGCITEREVTVTYTGVDKNYDGTDEAIVGVSDLAGVLADDEATLSAETITAKFDSRSAGRDKTITVTEPPTLIGEDAGNYVVALPTEPILADILAVQLTVEATAINKVYDGSNEVLVQLGELQGVPLDKDVSLVTNCAIGFASDENAGVDKIVEAMSIELTGADADGYEVAPAGTVTVTIEPKELQYDATGVDKVYDHTNKGEIEVQLSEDAITEDDVQFEVVRIPALFSQADVGDGIKLTAEDTPVLVGANANNYTVDDINGDLSADIQERPIFVMADDLAPVQYGSISSEELTAMVDLKYANVCESESRDVMTALIEPDVEPLNAYQVGEFPIEIEEGTGDPTSNYVFSYTYNKGKYSITAINNKPGITINTGFENLDVVATVDGEDCYLHSTSGGSITMYTDQVGEYVTVSNTEDGEERYFITDSHTVADVAEFEGDMTVTSDGAITATKSSVYKIRNSGIVLGKASGLNSLTVDNYSGTIVFDGVDAVCSVPYLNCVAGLTNLELHGDSIITEPAEIAAIRVPVVVSLRVVGEGSLNIKHLGQRTAAGIGGNAAEAAGDITVDSGTILGDSLGSGVGADTSAAGKVELNGGVVNADIDSDYVQDSSGDKLKGVDVDTSSTGLKGTLIATRDDSKDGMYYSVIVDDTNHFRQWVLESATKLWVCHEGKYYYADLTKPQPKLVAEGSGGSAGSGGGSGSGGSGGGSGSGGSGGSAGSGGGSGSGSAGSGSGAGSGSAGSGSAGSGSGADAGSGSNPDVDSGSGAGYQNGSLLDQLTSANWPAGSDPDDQSSDADAVFDTLTELLGGGTGAAGGAGTVNENGSYTTTYPDGNSVTTDKDGNVTFNTEGGTTTQNADGSSTTVDKNGNVTTVTKDGEVTTQHKDGSTTTYNEDGSTTTTNKDGSVTTVYPNGSSVTENVDGSSVTVYEDGSTVTTYKDGNVSFSKEGSKSKTNKDGSITFTDKDGNVTTVTKDGKVTTKHKDGSVTTYNKDGSTTTTYEDGREVTSYTDDRKVTVRKDGSITTTYRDGSSVTVYKDGKTVTKYKDGSTLIVNKDGNSTFSKDGVYITKTADDAIMLNAHKLTFGEGVEISVDGKIFSQTLKFDKDGYYMYDLYVKDKNTKTVQILHKVLFVIDSTAPEVILDIVEWSVFVLSEKSTNRKTYNTSLSFKIGTSDNMNKISSVKYKIVPRGTASGKVPWVTYADNKKITMKKAGKYVLWIKAADCAHNIQTIRSNAICIDRDNPKCNLKNLHVYKRGVVLKASDSMGVKSIVINGKMAGNKAKLSKRGYYKVTIKDYVGHKKTIHFWIR